MSDFSVILVILIVVCFICVMALYYMHRLVEAERIISDVRFELLPDDKKGAMLVGTNKRILRARCKRFLGIEDDTSM